MSLLPTEPSAPGLEIAIGYEPCPWIGGDYANVLTMPNSRVLLTVADVAGKGLPAAMVATGVNSIVHSAVRAGSDLTEIAQSINRFLLDSMDRQSFVTMLGVFEQSTGNAQCLNAGHPPMLIFSPDGGTRVLPYAHNPPLGVMPTDITLDDTVLNPASSSCSTPTASRKCAIPAAICSASRRRTQRFGALCRESGNSAKRAGRANHRDVGRASCRRRSRMTGRSSSPAGFPRPGRKARIKF